MKRPTTSLLAAALALMSLSPLAIAEDANSLPMINGEVKKVDESAGKMTIKHDAITNLDMGAMTMVFKASDPAMLKDVKPGEKIKFSADKVNGQITVMKVEKAK
ncbi:putative periplasmic copper binding protein [Hyphomicrobium sp. GJ21]|uniref:copper-binding protein n=1 Tax=unclassified Hyphomicrobium TaxID=2619925 RepID=UPI000622BF30|nr:copper-binding protein [Hyphomicrobium sp. GJ21]MBS0234525.1 copper-binding protein [Pseudomonadota bacterium]CEJ87960.1 putative periplasmic copper binding protein [Hyphomicrobium sp. GJ21]